MKNCCKCILAGRKFINEDETINVRKLSVIYERWYIEQVAVNIEDVFAFGVIKEYSKNLCMCDCHKIKLKG